MIIRYLIHARLWSVNDKGGEIDSYEHKINKLFQFFVSVMYEIRPYSPFELSLVWFSAFSVIFFWQKSSVFHNLLYKGNMKKNNLKHG